MKRVCPGCKTDISNTHLNRKYCSDKCCNKERYKREGQRSAPEQRKRWYRKRIKSYDHVEKLRAQGKARKKRVQDFIRRYKVLVGCKDCGYKKHHVALDFDHIRGNKAINVCNAKSIKQAKTEIRKCEVVCSNCHRIRTYKRLNYPCKPDIFEQTYDRYPEYEAGEEPADE